MLLLAQITPLADLSRVSLDLFFQFISLSHYEVPLLQRQHHSTRKKLKFNKMLTMLVMSCIFMSCNFDGPSFSAPPSVGPKRSVNRPLTTF